MSHRTLVTTMVATVLASMVAVPALAIGASPTPAPIVSPTARPTAPSATPTARPTARPTAPAATPTAPAATPSADASPPVVASPVVDASPSIPAGAPELEALFPTQIGGAPLTIDSVNGAQMEAQFPESDPATAKLIAVLAAQGKTIGDLSAANASAQTEGGFVAVIALRIAGTDAATLIDGFAPLVIGYDEIVKTSLQAGGKDVVKLTPTNSGPSVEPIYVHATGDILWFVSAQASMLDEVFSALP